MTVQEKLLNSTLEMCEKTAAKFPQFAADVLESKADLVRSPSTGHCAAILQMLVDIEEGTYTAPGDDGPISDPDYGLYNEMGLRVPEEYAGLPDNNAPREKYSHECEDSDDDLWSPDCISGGCEPYDFPRR